MKNNQFRTRYFTHTNTAFLTEIGRKVEFCVSLWNFSLGKNCSLSFRVGYDTYAMNIFNQLMKKESWKKIWIKKKCEKKILTLKKKFAGKECGHFNEVGRKMISFFFVLVVLPKINL